MTSIILVVATRLIFPLMLMFSLFLLLRGHDAPGGGFVGGLVAASAFALYAFATSVTRARDALGRSTFRLIGIGLLFAFASGLPGLFAGSPFLRALWTSAELPVIGKLSSVLLFDTGVLLLVVGVTLTIVFAMAEADEEEEE